ncbi:MAG: hypothetical protein IPG50_06805 [Myxococcales bacterium]|nr:hypothetical protein [Myxococcales bacterium]
MRPSLATPAWLFRVGVMVVLATATSGALLAAPPVFLPRPPAAARPDARADAHAEPGPRPCGTDGGDDCPLQGFMKQSAAPPSKGTDAEALAEAFDKIAALAPHVSAYPYWGSIAKDGANVARRGRIDAARVACVSCHEQYRARFRKELRTLGLAELPDAGDLEAGSPGASKP